MPRTIQIRQTGGPEVLACAGPAAGYSDVRLIEADRSVGLPEAISFDQASAMMRGHIAKPLLC